MDSPTPLAGTAHYVPLNFNNLFFAAGGAIELQTQAPGNRVTLQLILCTARLP